MHNASSGSLRLLVTTQTVDENDSNLSFFVRWIAGLAAQSESVTVICLSEGAHTLPHNVRVYSLGKEKGASGTFTYAMRFLKLIRAHRDEYDAILVHMNPEYLILGGFFWRMWRKKIGLWYTHKSVNMRLRIGALFAHVIFTASKESFRMSSPKVRILGHGIDTALFSAALRSDRDYMHVVTVGRISSTKRIAEMLTGVAEFKQRGNSVQFSIVGAPITPRDFEYEKYLRSEITRLGLNDAVRFLGALPYAKLPEIFRFADVMLNLSNTGSMDKAVLDALASGVPVITSNEAFRSVPVVLYIPLPDPSALADAILKSRDSKSAKLRDYVTENHSLPHLVRAIVGGLATERLHYV